MIDASEIVKLPLLLKSLTHLRYSAQLKHFTSSALLRSFALLGHFKLMRFPGLLISVALLRYSALLGCSALSTAEMLGNLKFTFEHDLDEGEILIVLILTINTGLNKIKGDKRQFSSRLRVR
jgi:hypothetical protein